MGLEREDEKKPAVFDASQDQWVEALADLAMQSQKTKDEVEDLFVGIRSDGLIKLLNLAADVETNNLHSLTMQGNYAGEEAIRILAFYKGSLQTLARLLAIVRDNKNQQSSPVDRCIARKEQAARQENNGESFETY